MLKVAILGYGGIARAHRKGYEELAERNAPVELVALCDIDPAQFEKTVAINQGAEVGTQKEYRTYTDLEEMLAKEELDVIDICLPTYLHCEYACKLLRRGYHVQCEKPMGLNAEQCAEMIKTAEESGKKLMIGMCLRFDGLYLALKELIDSGKYGRVESAYFERLSAMPRWGFDGWFHDYERCGGVGMDLHIHDVDMIRFLFGEPKAVTAVANDVRTKFTTMHSRFHYDDILVTAIADWGQSNSTKFRANCRINLERATIEVGHKGGITVYPDDGEPFTTSGIAKSGHMAEESLYFARTILGEIENDRNTLESAAQTVNLVKKLVESAENGGKIVEV
ncbi:MAG: Gfo/Idh/MocA family oxidoreductase [Clostridia bacterium]|nr:Gfo/Idh/MocA family oxidoreductase [Clostridia bacterium]